MISDSNLILSYLSKKYNIRLDSDLTDSQKNLHFLVTRVLDCHLYWVMSYSRWQDEQNWPLFKAEFLKESPLATEELLNGAREYNIEKYHYQGIGRCIKEDVYQSGIDDLKMLNALLGSNDFFFGKQIHSIDACCYGFLANIVFFNIDTPLKAYISSNNLLNSYIKRIRGLFKLLNKIL